MRSARGWLAAAAVGLAVSAAACGSSDDGGATTAAAGGATTAAPDARLAKIKAEVAALERRPTSIGLTEPVKGGIPKAKTIDYLQCGVPDCVDLGEHLKEATDAVGWKLNIVDIGLTPETVKAGWEKALRDRPDGVIATGGFPSDIFDAELQQFLDAGTPVITITDGNPPPGTFPISGPDRFELIGRNVANWVIAKTDGKAKVLFANVPAFSVQKIMEQSFKRHYEENCPGCEMEIYDAPATAIGKDLAGNIAQRVQANPGLNYLVLGFNDMATGVPDAVRGAGVADLPAVTQGQGKAQSAYVKAGDMLQAMYALPAPEMMWRCVDLFIRKFNGESTEQDTDGTNFPKWFITKDTVPSTTHNYPVVEDYQAQYKALWGLD